jgi:hypothetical protein
MHIHTLTPIHASDDEIREPMGLTDRDRCRACRGPIHRTDASGLCWSCMPTS